MSVKESVAPASDSIKVRKAPATAGPAQESLEGWAARRRQMEGCLVWRYPFEKEQLITLDRPFGA